MVLKKRVKKEGPKGPKKSAKGYEGTRTDIAMFSSGGIKPPLFGFLGLFIIAIKTIF